MTMNNHKTFDMRNEDKYFDDSLAYLTSTFIVYG